MLQLLTSKGADINASGIKGAVLERVARLGDVRAVTTLLENGATTFSSALQGVKEGYDEVFRRDGGHYGHLEKLVEPYEEIHGLLNDAARQADAGHIAIPLWTEDLSQYL